MNLYFTSIQYTIWQVFVLCSHESLFHINTIYNLTGIRAVQSWIFISHQYNIQFDRYSCGAVMNLYFTSIQYTIWQVFVRCSHESLFHINTIYNLTGIRAVQSWIFISHQYNIQFDRYPCGAVMNLYFTSIQYTIWQVFVRCSHESLFHINTIYNLTGIRAVQSWIFISHQYNIQFDRYSCGAVMNLYFTSIQYTIWQVFVRCSHESLFHINTIYNLTGIRAVQSWIFISHQYNIQFDRYSCGAVMNLYFTSIQYTIWQVSVRCSHESLFHINTMYNLTGIRAVQSWIFISHQYNIQFDRYSCGAIMNLYFTSIQYTIWQVFVRCSNESSFHINTIYNLTGIRAVQSWIFISHQYNIQFDRYSCGAVMNLYFTSIQYTIWQVFVRCSNESLFHINTIFNFSHSHLVLIKEGMVE